MTESVWLFHRRLSSKYRINFERLVLAVEQKDHKAYASCFSKKAKAKYCEPEALDFVTHDMGMELGRWIITEESVDAARFIVKYAMCRDGGRVDYVSKVRALRDGSAFVVDREEIQSSRPVGSGSKALVVALAACPNGKCPCLRSPNVRKGLSRRYSTTRTETRIPMGLSQWDYVVGPDESARGRACSLQQASKIVFCLKSDLGSGRTDAQDAIPGLKGSINASEAVVRLITVDQKTTDAASIVAEYVAWSEQDKSPSSFRYRRGVLL